MKVTAAPYTLNHVVSRAPDTFEWPTGDLPFDQWTVPQAELMPFPHHLLNLQHAQGSTSARGWSNWTSMGLDRIHTVIYVPHPTLALNNANEPEVFQQYFQGGNNAEDALDRAMARSERPGTRHNNTVIPHHTIRETPGHPGFFTFITMQGWLGHLDLSGRIFTAAGRQVPPGVVQRRDGSSRQMVGTFDRPWNGPLDFAFHPDNDHIIFVADTFNDRITITDGKDRPPLGPITTTWATFPKTFKPYSIEIIGREMVVMGRGLASGESWQQGTGGMVSIDIDTKAQRDISGGYAWQSPQVVRAYVDGTLIVGTANDMWWWQYDWRGPSKARRQIHRVINPQGGQVVRPNLWIWLWVDHTGSCGPIGDIIYTSGGGNFGPTRIRDVTTVAPAIAWMSGTGQCNSGMSGIQHSPGGGYGWPIIGSDTYPLLLHAGAASMGIRVLNYLPGRDNQKIYDEATRQAGENIWSSSTAPNLETNTPGLPSIALLHGYQGESHLGLTHTSTADGTVWPAGNAEELLQMPWPEFCAFVRAGSGGTRPRVLTDDDLRKVRYYLKVATPHMLVSTKVDPVGHAYPWVYPPAAPYFATATVVNRDVTVRWHHADPTRVAMSQYLVQRTGVDPVRADVWLEVPITETQVVDHDLADGVYRYHVYSEAGGRRSIGVPVPFTAKIDGGGGGTTVTLRAPETVTLEST